MLTVYLSLSGNIRKFVSLTGLESIEINYSNPLIEIDEDFILIIPSYDDEITDIISEFIEYKNNINHLIAIVGSGSTNFGEIGYCYNAVDISMKYDKPLIFKFEHSGDDSILDFKKEVEKIEVTRTK